jgi:hypothetical protein
MRGAGTYGLSPASIGSRWLVAYPNREISFYETGDSARRAVLTTDGKTTIRSSDLVDYSTVVGGLPTFVGTHLVFARAAEEGTLMAIPFDSTRMEALGEPKPVRQGIRIEGGGYGVAQYAVSDDGTLIYAAGTNELLMQLVTRDRRGDTATLPFPKLDVSAINVSWDGRFMAARLWSPGVPPKWVRLDLDNGRQTPLPDSLLISAIMDADGESVLANKLAPDGRRVTLRFRRAGANPDTVVRDGAVIAVSRSGHMFLVVGQRGRPETWAVWRDSVGHPPQRMGGTALASLSPSGDWAAITIEIAGKSQVRIVRTARPADYYDLTTSGGEEPRWSADEREIIYRSLNSWYSVAMPSRAGDAPGKPVPLFTGYYSNMPGYSHGLLPDGRHLLFRGSSVQTTGRLEVVTNWLSEVRRIAPVARR